MIAIMLALAFQCPDGTPPPCGRVASRAPVPEANSVAVLYFDNESRDTNDLYLADGLTEEIITRLTGIERLTVRSRHVVRRFRGTALGDPAAVARALNVAYLVTGSVRRSGERIRVNAELIRGASGAQVWARPFDQSGTDALAIQETVAGEVATGIVGRLLPAERGTIAARSTRDPAAYDHFLRGNFLLATRAPSAMMRAAQQYDSAAASDPSFTDAVARVAYTYAAILDNEADVGLTRETLVTLGVATAERAVRMDSMSSEAWLALAYIRESQSPVTLAGAREAFQRAIALNPRSAEAHHQYADFLARSGDATQARSENLRALALEPGRGATYVQVMNQAFVAGRIREALRLADSAEAGGVDARTWRFIDNALLGDTAAARRALTALGSGLGPDLMSLFGLYMAAPRGDTAAVGRFRRAALAPPAATVTGTQIASPNLAILLVNLDDREGALQALEAARPRGAVLHWIMGSPRLDPIRSDPRFQRVWNESDPAVTP
ncbi:MAG: tetratricopeptide repeat protein [Gemmatimonadales bacterium]